MRLPGVAIQRDAPLAPLTTFRVGGPADWFVHVRTGDEMAAALQTAAECDVPVTVLGGGSNVVIADAGIRGLVIRFHGGEVRHDGSGLITADAGVTINGLVRWTIVQGLRALEAWAGTPGTVGGAIYGNAHFQGRLIGELVERVTVADRQGRIQAVDRRSMAFGYDVSRLQTTREIALTATFRVLPGEPDRLREVARASLAFRKATQPLNLASAGCIFQNPDPAIDPLPPEVPASAGALIDRAGLKGLAIGGARVSPVHANFIVNEGGATAQQIAALVERCRSAVAERFGITLRDEVVFLGHWGPASGIARG